MRQNDESSEWDAALRAAFGPDEGLSVTGVVAQLEDRLGIHSQVLLRDEPADETRVLELSGPGRVSAPHDRYQIHGEIARGGVGIVLRGRDVDLGRDIAMKMLQDKHAGNASMVQRFVEEAQITGQLQHPGILPIYEMGLRGENQPYFTMKLIKGRTLSGMLGDREDNDPEGFLGVFEDVCQTLAYAHTRGVIHRDLKPSNIMVGAFGEVQIVDWGLAKVLPQGGAADDARYATPAETVVETVRGSGSVSVAGSVMGTPAYMSPEQARGETDTLDERTDVFSLGGILCEVLTGEPPFSGTASEMMVDAAAGRVEPAQERLRASGADEELIELACSCLSAHRKDRPASARILAEAVTRHRESAQQRVRAAELAVIEEQTRVASERRARRLTLGLAGAIVLSIVVGLTGYIQVQSDRQSRIDVSSEKVNDALSAAAILFGEARLTPVGENTVWTALLAAGDHVRSLLDSFQVDAPTEQRARAFLDELEQAHRDRIMIEGLEDLVIFGATHSDPESWLWMENALRQAYIEYGLDLDLRTTTRGELAEHIRSSPLGPQLTNGLELWIATVFHLGNWGLHPHSYEEMMEWVEILYVADPDPYRSAIRRILYLPDPRVALEDLNALAVSPEFEKALPRTLAWLAGIYWRTEDIDAGLEVFRRALELHPSDFMLNFDTAYFLVARQRWQEATRYYHRALAIRPQSAGIWRCLGVALREVDDLAGSLWAFDQAASIRGDYAPIHVERGLTLQSMDRLDEALEAFTLAVRLNPESGVPRCHLGRALHLVGRHDEAVEQLQRGHDAGSEQVGWALPSGEWLEEAKRAQEERRHEDP